MNEVYWGCYRFDASAPWVPIVLMPERVGPQESVAPPQGTAWFAGNGAGRFPQLQSRLTSQGLHFREGLYPSAAAIARIGSEMLTRGEGVGAAGALPVYIRDDVARPSGAIVTPMS